MDLPLQHVAAAFAASKGAGALGSSSVIMALIATSLALLFGLALLVSLLRILRRRVARAARNGTEPVARQHRVDAWRESAARVPLDPDGPTERDLDDELPPTGGRFR